MTAGARQRRRGWAFGTDPQVLFPLVLLVAVSVLFALVWQAVGAQSDYANSERDGVRYIQALGPLEIAGIASGLATITGAGGGIGDPLDKVRQGLGLDRLAVGSGTNGGATLEAGRYLAPGVYLGAKQSASGGGAQANVQIDIAKGLKLEGTAGTGGTSAVGSASSSNGTSVGLTYQFEY